MDREELYIMLYEADTYSFRGGVKTLIKVMGVHVNDMATSIFFKKIKTNWNTRLVIKSKYKLFLHEIRTNGIKNLVAPCQ